MGNVTRSEARRAYLTKVASGVAVKQASANRSTLIDSVDAYRGAGMYHNALQPHNVLAAGGIGGGAYLLGSAINPTEERTTQDRMLRALGGAALVGGSAYLAANKDVRERLSRNVYRLLGKAKRTLT